MQHTYFFSQERTEGGAAMKELLGNKGANLAEMASLRNRAAPGFTITYPELASMQTRANINAAIARLAAAQAAIEGVR